MPLAPSTTKSSNQDTKPALAGPQDATMPFIAEVPSKDDIDDYRLPFHSDLVLPERKRRTWLADHARNIFAVVGLKGNQAAGDPIKGRVLLLMSGKRYEILLKKEDETLSLRDSPYIIQWGAIESIYDCTHDVWIGAP